MARPREFDPDQVLDSAMHLFWEQGFDGTSIGDLEARMGINRFSIYNTFGDKQGLFLAAMDRYRDRVVSELARELEHGDDGLGALRRFFQRVASAVASPDSRIGCFMVNCAVERSLDDPDAAERVRAHFDRIERAFHRCLKLARDSGQIGADARLRDRARKLAVTFQGVLVGVKMAQDPASLRGALRQLQLEIDTW